MGSKKRVETSPLPHSASEVELLYCGLPCSLLSRASRSFASHFRLLDYFCSRATLSTLSTRLQGHHERREPAPFAVPVE